MLGKSSEDYLEVIYLLNQENGRIRSIDVAHYLNYSKPSMCHATKKLQDNGCLSMDESCLLYLIEKGEKIVVRLYERRRFLTNQLIESGISPEVTRQDVCRLEHIISDESFTVVKQSWGPP